MPTAQGILVRSPSPPFRKVIYLKLKAKKIVVHVNKTSIALKVNDNRVVETTEVRVLRTNKSKAVHVLKAKKIVAPARKISKSKAVHGPKGKRIVVQGPKTKKIVVHVLRAKISAVQNHRIRNATKASRRSSSHDVSSLFRIHSSARPSTAGARCCNGSSA